MLGSIIRAPVLQEAWIRSEGIEVVSTARVVLVSELASLSGSLEQCCGPYESGHLVPLPLGDPFDSSSATSGAAQDPKCSYRDNMIRMYSNFVLVLI